MNNHYNHEGTLGSPQPPLDTAERQRGAQSPRPLAAEEAAEHPGAPGTRPAHEIAAEIEQALTDDDIDAWHRGELTDHAEALVEKYGTFQVWGSRDHGRRPDPNDPDEEQYIWVEPLRIDWIGD